MEFWYALPTEWWGTLLSKYQWLFAWIVSTLVLLVVFIRAWKGDSDSLPASVILALILPPVLWGTVFLSLGFVSSMIWLATN